MFMSTCLISVSTAITDFFHNIVCIFSHFHMETLFLNYQYYKILVEKELEFIEKNENMIKKYASIIYNQKNNGYDVSYIKNVVDFKLLEQKCKEYRNSK